MVVDIGEVKRHIKPKADSTLYNMRKSDLIEYVRTLEHNYNVGATFLENQAKYIESLEMVQVVRCKDCKYFVQGEPYDPCECMKWMVKFGVAYTTPDGYCHKAERKDNG